MDLKILKLALEDSFKQFFYSSGYVSHMFTCIFNGMIFIVFTEILLLQSKKEKKEKKEKKKKEKKKKEKEKKKKKDKEKEKESKAPERRPFDRDLDLKVNRFDDAMKKKYIKSAQGISSNFGHGSQQYL